MLLTFEFFFVLLLLLFLRLKSTLSSHSWCCLLKLRRIWKILHWRVFLVFYLISDSTVKFGYLWSGIFVITHFHTRMVWRFSYLSFMVLYVSIIMGTIVNTLRTWRLLIFNFNLIIRHILRYPFEALLLFFWTLSFILHFVQRNSMKTLRIETERFFLIFE